MKIAILGAGAFGTALGGVLAEKGYDIDYYDREVEKERLADVMADAAYVVLCIPSKVVPYMLPHLPKDKPLVVATKGILSDRGFNEFKDYMVLSGPGFADDIKARKLTLLTATDARVIDLFMTSYMKFDLTDDRRGVLMCGALKNVYAILAGLRGLERETSEWQDFIDAAAGEMKLVLTANGAKAETVDLACGVGDLKLTCGYPSRNFEYGDILRRDPDYEPENTVEGLSAILKIRRGEIVVPERVKLLAEVISAVK